MKAVVAAFNQEKALVGAFSVIMNLRMELFEALVTGRGRGASSRHRGRRGYCILLKLRTGGRRNILLLVGGQIECYHLLLILLHHAEHSTPDFCYNAELDVEWSWEQELEKYILFIYDVKQP